MFGSSPSLPLPAWTYRHAATLRTARTARSGKGAAPHGVACDAAGNLYAADFHEGYIDKFGPGGEFLAAFGRFPDGTRNVAVDSGGFVYAATARVVVKMDGEGRELLRWRVDAHPHVAIHAGRRSGLVYVHAEGETAAYDTQGRRQPLSFPRTARLWSVVEAGDGSIVGVSAIGGDGLPGTLFRFRAGDSEAEAAPLDRAAFNSPESLDLDASGNLYLCDTYNHRVVVLDPAGRRLAAFGSRGEGDAEFRWPQGIWVSRDGRAVHVGDSGNGAVKRWVRTGEPSSGGPDRR